MIDFSGTDICVGDYIRHSHEPLPPKAVGQRGLGQHCHNLFGVKRVKEIHSSVVVTEGNYVVLGCLVEVLGAPSTKAPYLVPFADALIGSAA